jgi:iron complex transport system ATP-binding protein
MIAAPTAHALRIANLTAGYRGHRVLDHLSLDGIVAGRVTALVGPNGAGKSTLLKVLAGLLPARGSVTLGDRELLQWPLRERARHVTFMPQSLPQRIGLTVLEATISALRASATTAPEPRATDHDSRPTEHRALAALERIGISDLGLSPLDQLSGGERQLASLAQAIVREPAVLLLDEPTSSLDLRHQVVVMRLIADLATEGRIVVVVLHDLNLAARWAGQIVVLHHGRAAAVGSPLETMTPEVLARVYGVRATIEVAASGRPHVVVDDLIEREAVRS